MGTAKHRRLERGSTRGDHASIRCMQQVVSIAINQENRQRLSTNRLLQVGAIDGGRL